MPEETEQEKKEPKGTRKTTTQVEEPIFDEASGEDREDDEDFPGLPDELKGLFSDLGADARLQIYRRPPGGRKKYCDTIDPWDFTMEWLRDEWGGGRYQLSLRKDGKYAGAVTVEIEGPPKKRRDDDDDDDDEPALNPQLGVVLVETLRELRDLRRDMQHPPAGAQQGNPVEMGLSIAQALQSATNPLIEYLTREQEDRKGPDSSDMIEVFLRGMELAREMAGPPAGSNPYLEMARPLVESLTRTLERQQPPRALQPYPTPNPPEGADRVETDEERDERRPEGQPPGWAHFVRPIVAQLEVPARTDGDPGLYAELVLDQVGGNEDVELFLLTATDQLERFLPDFFRWVPSAREHRDWFTRLWQELGAQLREDEDWPGGDEGPGGPGELVDDGPGEGPGEGGSPQSP